MKASLGWDSFEEDKDLESIERYLQIQLFPVEPAGGFISSLRVRLKAVSKEKEAAIPTVRSPHILKYTLLGAAGVISSLVLVITGGKALARLVYAMRTERAMKNQVAAKPAA
jgi:hypothetical protein